jgi:hypothetical protein
MPDLQHPDPFGDREVPAALERRVHESLRSAGLIQPADASRPRRALAGVALLAAVVASFLVGRMTAGGANGRHPEPLTSHPERSEGSAVAVTPPAFLFLLYEGPSYRDDRPVREIVAEYGGWADSLRRSGVLVLGEKLGDTSTVVGPGRRPPETPTGLFIVRAANIGAAAAVASTSPHVRQGGHVFLAPVDH